MAILTITSSSVCKDSDFWRGTSWLNFLVVWGLIWPNTFFSNLILDSATHFCSLWASPSLCGVPPHTFGVPASGPLHRFRLSPSPWQVSGSPAWGNGTAPSALCIDCILSSGLIAEWLLCHAALSILFESPHTQTIWSPGPAVPSGFFAMFSVWQQLALLTKGPSSLPSVPA